MLVDLSVALFNEMKSSANEKKNTVSLEIPGWNQSDTTFVIGMTIGMDQFPMETSLDNGV